MKVKNEDEDENETKEGKQVEQRTRPTRSRTFIATMEEIETEFMKIVAGYYSKCKFSSKA